jgi:holo-[acyl-carrier protein] synthase
MIVGIGIDLIEIEKIAKDLQSEVYLRKVFTEAEIIACASSPNSAEHFAGKFAAKEAFMKAIGNGIRQGVWFTQIEVLNHESGQPYVQVSGEASMRLNELGATNIHVSITHTHNAAAAVIILEKQDDK